MKLLIVSATELEIGPYLSRQPVSAHEVDIIVAGVGMVATTYRLTDQLSHRHYDFALQVGVAGAFDKRLRLGETVFITSECWGDMGAEDRTEYLDVFQMGLLEHEAYPYTSGKLLTSASPIHDKVLLPRVSGLTVNTVSGSEKTIEHRQQKFGAQVESMEGAAFHYVCLCQRLPFAQVRSISNYVTPRDKSAWKMKEAIISLNEWLINFIEHL
jgi:futalosine hydrolase